MDWLTELIGKSINEGYSDTQIAKDIREEIKKRKPSEKDDINASFSNRNLKFSYGWNEALSEYDKALGIE